MSFESLIPFGLKSSTGELVDVNGVERGNACGCICPSCDTPLVARKGDKKEWHFAHRSRSVHEHTERECHYSFAVSVRLMIRQLSENGLAFRVPPLSASRHAVSETSGQSKLFERAIASEALLDLENVKVGVNFAGAEFDVLGYVEGVPFVVYVTYKDRQVPCELQSPGPKRCGVVEFNVGGLYPRFQREKEGRYISVLKKYIESEIEGRGWVYHPREGRVQESLEAEVKSWLSEQDKKPVPERQAIKPRVHAHPAKVVSAAGKVGADQARNFISKPLPVMNFECVVCKAVWSSGSRVCEVCGTHLFTTESASQGERK